MESNETRSRETPKITGEFLTEISDKLDLLISRLDEIFKNADTTVNDTHTETELTTETNKRETGKLTSKSGDMVIQFLFKDKLHESCIGPNNTQQLKEQTEHIDAININ